LPGKTLSASSAIPISGKSRSPSTPLQSDKEESTAKLSTSYGDGIAGKKSRWKVHHESGKDAEDTTTATSSSTNLAKGRSASTSVSFTSSPSLSSTQLGPRTRHPSTLSPEEQERVRIVNTGKKKFNISPQKGIQYLADNEYFLNNPPNEDDVAEFLLQGDMLSKKMIGEYLGEG
jgi:Sec7-like guanine-nucleotide exchange factor